MRGEKTLKQEQALKNSTVYSSSVFRIIISLFSLPVSSAMAEHFRLKIFTLLPFIPFFIIPHEFEILNCFLAGRVLLSPEDPAGHEKKQFHQLFLCFLE